MACKVIYKGKSFDKDDILKSLEGVFSNKKKGVPISLTENKISEATDFTQELLDEKIIPAGYQDMAKSKPMEFWEFVAQQAQNVDANWQPLKAEDAPLSEQAAIDGFGETIVNYAKELFPLDKKLSNKKNTQIQEINKKRDEIENRRKQELDRSSEVKTLYTSIKENENSPYDIILPEAKGNKTVSLTSPSKGVIERFELTEEEINELNNITNLKDKRTFKKKIASRKLNEINEAINQKYDKEISELETQQKIETNEKQISKEANAQKGNEEINAEEGANEADASKEVDVLTEEGAEPAAEAHLELTEDEIQKPLEASRAKKVSGTLRAFANKIQEADITGAGVKAAQSDITRLPREVVAFAINRVADAIDAGEAVVNAIQKGVDYIRERGHKMDDDSFKTYTTDLIAGKKPRVRVSTEPQEKKAEEKQGKEMEGEEDKEEGKEPPKPPEAPPTETQTGEGGNIDDYEMTTSGEVNRFLSGDTWDSVFGEKAEGDQTYLTQKLSDMLQDGKNMIAIAQNRWGGDVMMYGKPLFQLIQGISNDKQLSNKKAVLLATFLGELQEAKKRSPERFDAISQLEKAVFAYYQNYMNVRGKEIVAGRLLRLYRDKYIGDIYADAILEAAQVKAKKAIVEAEQTKQIDDKTAEEGINPVTEEEKKAEDKEAKKKSESDKKKQTKKKKMSANEAAQKADTKLKEIEERLGRAGRGGLIDRIKDAIKKLNCK